MVSNFLSRQTVLYLPKSQSTQPTKCTPKSEHLIWLESEHLIWQRSLWKVSVINILGVEAPKSAFSFSMCMYCIQDSLIMRRCARSIFFQVPVPSVHTYCAPKSNGSWYMVSARVARMFWSAGIEVRALHSCVLLAACQTVLISLTALWVDNQLSFNIAVVSIADVITTFKAQFIQLASMWS